MNILKSLGRLEKVDLRAIWSSEASDFTPWLAQADNLKLLGETIGLDLDLESTEKPVGPFRADIVCRETIDGTWVLIENQLERTDHGHLGQLLTYAAGLDAVTIVWVAERFTDEHRAALDWLNEVTDENINLFGLEIELWRIGDSAVAPKFNVVSQPNDWIKRVAAGRQQTGESSDLDVLKIEFWTALQNYLQEQRSMLKSQKPSSNHWTNFAIGRTNFSLVAFVGMRDGYVGVALVLTGSDAKAHYHLLAREHKNIETEVGEALQWRELPENKQSDVSLYWRGIMPNDPTNWPTYHAWMYDKLEKFYRVFFTRVRTLKASDYVPPVPTESESDEMLS